MLFRSDDAIATVNHAYREGGALYLAHIAQAEAEAERDEARAELARLTDLNATQAKTLDAALAAAERLQRERDELRARLVVEQSK